MTTGKDGTARVAHAETGEELVVMSGTEDWVTSAGFTGGAGSSVVTSSADGTVRVWDAVFQPELKELARLPGPVTAIEVPDGGRVRATMSDGQQYVIDTKTGRGSASSRGHGGGHGAWSAPTAWSRRFAGGPSSFARTGARRLSEATVTASPQSRSRLRDIPRHGEPRPRRSHLGRRKRRAGPTSAAQHRSSRCAVQPGRTLGDHGCESSRPLGRAGRDERRPTPRARRHRSLRPRSVRTATRSLRAAKMGRSGRTAANYAVDSATSLRSPSAASRQRVAN